MNIGFDGSYAILKNNTTEGNYSKIVVDAMSECYPRHKLYVYTPTVEKRSTATTLAVQGSVQVKQPRKSMNRTLWMNFQGMVDELNRHHVHVYHGLAGKLPMRIGRAHAVSVVTVHGLAYKRFPDDYSWWQRFKKSYWTRTSCHKATHIVATSQCVKDDLVQHLNIAPEKIDVIYPAVDKRFLTPIIDAELDTVRDKYKLPRRYILLVSSMMKHKNVAAVLEAMRQMRDQEVGLVVVGTETPYYVNEVFGYARKHHLLHRLVHIQRAHAVDMPSIYRMASAFVAPARYEGFGLAVIEAQACSVPVIAAAGTSLEEAAGDAALFFDPDDTASLAGHLDNMLADEALRTHLIEAGLKNIERFTHRRLAQQLDELYHNILRR